MGKEEIALPERKTRKPANVALQGDTVRVSYESGTISSVLVTEIASVESEEVTDDPNGCLFGVAVIMCIPVGIALAPIVRSLNIGQEARAALLIIVSISISVFMYKKLAKPEVKWDDVHVETRGGKTITYSVDLGTAVREIDKIESFKRQLSRQADARDSGMA